MQTNATVPDPSTPDGVTPSTRREPESAPPHIIFRIVPGQRPYECGDGAIVRALPMANVKDLCRPGGFGASRRQGPETQPGGVSPAQRRTENPSTKRVPLNKDGRSQGTPAPFCFNSSVSSKSFDPGMLRAIINRDFTKLQPEPKVSLPTVFKPPAKVVSTKPVQVTVGRSYTPATSGTWKKCSVNELSVPSAALTNVEASHVASKSSSVAVNRCGQSVLRTPSSLVKASTGASSVAVNRRIASNQSIQRADPSLVIPLSSSKAAKVVFGRSLANDQVTIQRMDPPLTAAMVKKAPLVHSNVVNRLAQNGQTKYSWATLISNSLKKRQNNSNVTVDTFLLETPSLTVPYVYERPALSRLKKDSCGSEKIQPELNFFDSAVGKFFVDFGLNMVQERVQTEHLKAEIRNSKQKLAASKDSIVSLKRKLESVRANNKPFLFKSKKCCFCSFRTESELCMQHHLETPHKKKFTYLCNFCLYKTRVSGDVLSHMANVHGIAARPDNPPGLHQCPQCSFEGNLQLAKQHRIICDKNFQPERNQDPTLNWEPPAKVFRTMSLARQTGNVSGGHLVSSAEQRLVPLSDSQSNHHQQQRIIYVAMPTQQTGPATASAIGNYKVDLKNKSTITQPRSYVMKALESEASKTVPALTKAAGQSTQGDNICRTNLPTDSTTLACEICDGNFTSFEELRIHMLRHNEVIHPQIKAKCPPLTCQHCAVRTFTDQGMVRHLLGTHGLVTDTLLRLAKKKQDSGRCPICQKIYHWKLVQHVVKEHHKKLKAVHMSFRCRFCTAIFSQYKMSENHVFEAHNAEVIAASKRERQVKPVSFV